MACGLVKGHAYSVTGLEEVSPVEFGGTWEHRRVDFLKSGQLSMPPSPMKELARQVQAGFWWGGEGALWDKLEVDEAVDAARFISVRSECTCLCDVCAEARDQHWLSLGGSPYCEAVSPTEHGPYQLVRLVAQ